MTHQSSTPKPQAPSFSQPARPDSVGSAAPDPRTNPPTPGGGQPPQAAGQGPSAQEPAATPSPPAESAAPAEATPAPVEDPLAWVRVGRVGTGRRVGPVPEETLASIRRFASERHIPGLGTLVELAQAYGHSGDGPGLGVEAFSEIRRQLGGLVEELDSVAIHVGPVLFVKSRAKNQPGTALRWLHEDERRVLAGHPELLDQPARLTANLKKRIAGEAAEASESEPD